MGSCTAKALLTKERKGDPTRYKHLNETAKGLVFCCIFLGFLYPILNIGFGQSAKDPLPFDLILCKIMTIPMVLGFF